MIKSVKLLLLLTFIGLAFFAAPLFKGEQGYVYISIGGWLLEGTVVQLTTSILALAFTLWLVVWLFRLTLRTVVFPSKWWSSRQLASQSNYLQSGIDFMALGQWQQASRQFDKVKRKERIETAKQLKLVCAAHDNLQDKLAQPTAESGNEAISAQFAKLRALKSQEKYQDAKLLITDLKKPIHKQPLPLQQLALEILILNADWQDVANLLPKLNKSIEKGNDQMAYLAWQTHLESVLTLGLDGFVATHSVNQLQQVWQGWSKAVKNLDAVRNAYFAVLAQHKQHTQIEDALVQMSKYSDVWLLELIRKIYAHSHHVPMPKLFAQIQKKAAKQPDDKVLITILAYLAAGDKDHQLAKQALEQVIYSNNNVWDSRLYACSLAELGEMRHSVEVFKSLPSH